MKNARSGSVRWARKSPNRGRRPLGGGTEIIPPEGRMFRLYAKYAMNRKPTQNGGRLWWMTAMKGIDLSSFPPTDLAARRPIIVPKKTTRSVPVVKSTIVLGR